MDKTTHLTILYDYYSELLTEHQRLYFEEYYFQNLSLGEISDNYKISRNAVHKNIKTVEDKLTEYEDKLKLYKKSLIIDKIISKISDKKIKAELEDIK